MDEPFELPVVYKGEELAFSARLLQLGYTHKFAVVVNGQEILFEPDEERDYRAVIEPEQMEGKTDVNKELIKAIVDAIEAAVK